MHHQLTVLDLGDPATVLDTAGTIPNTCCFCFGPRITTDRPVEVVPLAGDGVNLTGDGGPASEHPHPAPHADSLWISDAANFELLWRLMGVPALPGYRPAAITAVLVAIDGEGHVARYPLHAQLSTVRMSEPAEVANAIATLRHWRQQDTTGH
jgi:hypothetical protein